MVFERIRGKRLDWLLGGLLFLLLMLRACAYGAQYWPQLDDYIQYHNYAAGFTFRELQALTGLLSSRPLAGLADYFLWSPLFDRMILGVAAISALYALCVLWMKRLMERYVAVGPLFPVIMALLPLGMEGTYWMSASTRVVCGLFFACLTALAFGRWLDRGEGWAAAAFGALVFFPFGFYEQSAVLAMTLVFGMALLEFRGKWRRALLALWAFPASGLYFWVTGQFAVEGVYSSRAELVLPTSPYYWNTFLPDILGQVKAVFLDADFYITVKGFLRGLRQILSGELLLWALAAAAVCVLLGWMFGRTVHTPKKRYTALALLIGVLLAVAPVTPFLILANPWFSLRGAVTSFAGIALVCDAAVMGVWRHLPACRKGSAMLAAVMALVFCIAGASEVGDYRTTYENDHRAAQAVLAQLAQDRIQPEAQVGILGMEPSFLPDQNCFWHEHIHGCTESDWAFSGLLECLDGRGERPAVTPLPTDPIYRRWNAQSNRPWSFDVLYWYDGSALRLLTLEQIGELEYLAFVDGEPFGRIWEEPDGIGYFRLT